MWTLVYIAFRAKSDDEVLIATTFAKSIKFLEETRRGRISHSGYRFLSNNNSLNRGNKKKPRIFG